MFSYVSNKNSQSTLQNHLIEEIQFIANEIFDPHSLSIPRTELQEMSLQLSPATSQQHDSQIINHHHQNLQINFFTNIQSNQKSYHHPLSQNQHLFQSEKKTRTQLKHSKVPEFSPINQQKNERLTKSMISSQHFKEPGSFSKKYLQQKDPAGSQVSIRPKKSQNYQVEKKIKNQHSPLTVSNMNKSNILKGLLNEKNSSDNKSGHKKGRFSQSYSSNYISPYSSRGMKQNPKSYMQKSVSHTKKSKQALQIQFLKQKIHENIQPQISHRIQKASKPKNLSFSHVKSKYKQTKPLIHEYQAFAEQHIYKMIKQQMTPWHQKNNQNKNFSQQQIQNNWQQFIKNQQKFIENKKQWLASKKLQKFQQQKAQIYPSSNLASYLTEQNSTFESNPHKMTPEDFVKKYKREKDKLKKKLESNQISNFLDKTYFDSVKQDRQISKSTYWMINERQKQNETMRMSTINEQAQKEQNLIKMMLIQKEKSQQRKGQQNFFISVGSESPVPNRRQTSYKNNTHSRKNTTLAQSSIYEQKIKSKENKTSRDLPSERLGTERSSKKKDINDSFTPFRGKKNYFSKQQSIQERDFFNGSKQNINQFNCLKGKINKKSGSKKQENKQSSRVKQLSNPKYFKSIVEMRQYSSNSKQRRQSNKRTLQKSQDSQQNQQIETKINYIEIKKNQQIQGSRQNRKQDYQKRHKTKEFDQTLMNQIVKDLNLMRSQIEENKKNRKYKMQNYSNLSNLRQQKKPQLPSQQTGFFNLSSHDHESLHPNLNTSKQKMSNKQIIRANNHLNTNHFQNEKNQFKPYIHESRSVSPIQRQQSILMKNNRKQFTVIESDEQRWEGKSKDWSGLNRQIERSNIILVRNRQEIEFVLDGQESNQQKE